MNVDALENIVEILSKEYYDQDYKKEVRKLLGEKTDNQGFGALCECVIDSLPNRKSVQKV